jgi:hypothetical protein
MHGFVATANVSAGPHKLCVHANNIGAGATRALGCKVVTDAGHAVKPALPPPTHAPFGRVDRMVYSAEPSDSPAGRSTPTRPHAPCSTCESAAPDVRRSPRRSRARTSAATTPASAPTMDSSRPWPLRARAGTISATSPRSTRRPDRTPLSVAGCSPSCPLACPACCTPAYRRRSRDRLARAGARLARRRGGRLSRRGLVGGLDRHGLGGAAGTGNWTPCGSPGARQYSEVHEGDDRAPGRRAGRLGTDPLSRIARAALGPADRAGPRGPAVRQTTRCRPRTVTAPGSSGRRRSCPPTAARSCRGFPPIRAGTGRLRAEVPRCRPDPAGCAARVHRDRSEELRLLRADDVGVGHSGPLPVPLHRRPGHPGRAGDGKPAAARRPGPVRQRHPPRRDVHRRRLHDQRGYVRIDKISSADDFSLAVRP